jgi:hypothetical protein
VSALLARYYRGLADTKGSYNSRSRIGYADCDPIILNKALHDICTNQISQPEKTQLQDLSLFTNHNSISCKHTHTHTRTHKHKTDIFLTIPSFLLRKNPINLISTHRHRGDEISSSKGLLILTIGFSINSTLADGEAFKVGGPNRPLEEDFAHGLGDRSSFRREDGFDLGLGELSSSWEDKLGIRRPLGDLPSDLEGGFGPVRRFSDPPLGFGDDSEASFCDFSFLVEDRFGIVLGSDGA